VVASPPVLEAETQREREREREAKHKEVQTRRRMDPSMWHRIAAVSGNLLLFYPFKFIFPGSIIYV
jgi:hypothetical protein